MSSHQPIPKIIHQTWKDKHVPPNCVPLQRTWLTHHPDWEYWLWTDVDNRAFISEHYAWFLPVYDGYPENIMRADAVRYFMLYHYGGLYVDLDFECLRPLEPLLVGREVVIALEPLEHLEKELVRQRSFKQVLCNALIASQPKHPFWEQVFQELKVYQNANDPLDATGPFMLTRAYDSFSQREALTIESSERLCPITDEQSRHGILKDNATRQRIAKTAYAIHHWHGTWWPKPNNLFQRLFQIAIEMLKILSKKKGKLALFIKQKKALIKYRINAYKRSLRLRIASEISAQMINPSGSNQVCLSLLVQGQTIARVILDIKQSLIAFEQAATMPLVSCLMVTCGRFEMAKRSIHCFCKQTYPNKELVIIDNDDTDILANWVKTLRDSRIVYRHLPNERKPLGELRNIAVERANGSYIAQWDDDDLSAPKRLAIQMVVIHRFQTDACFLQREQLWYPQERRFAISSLRLWENSFVCAKDKLPPYPILHKGEDTPVAEQVALQGSIALLDFPELYTYIFHNANTFDSKHFEGLLEEATEIYTQDDYDVRIKQLEAEFDLSPWVTARPSIEKAKHQTFASRNRTDFHKILILTPVKDAERFLPSYFNRLKNLSYPHDCLSVAFLESDSVDNTYAWIEDKLPELQSEFARAKLFKRDFNYHSDLPRWEPSQQFKRRSILAKSRNYLLSQALESEQWVLWIDADMTSWPDDVIEQLLDTEKDIVVPHCVTENGKTFDLNTFKLKLGAEKWDWSLYILDGILQPPVGYGRLYLSELRDHERIQVDAVGGTMLLIQANLHREGLIFPPYSYKHFIETEGLAVMAKDMGYSCWGLPNLEIVHPLY
jgi:mannosyltransferase OCH1-like enzyme/glycosyltransferase involved in cell wall biosynthesis